MLVICAIKLIETFIMSKLQLYPQQLIAVYKITYSENNKITISPIELGKNNFDYELELPFGSKRLFNSKFYYIGTECRVVDIEASVILHSDTQSVIIEGDLILFRMDVSTSLGIPADTIEFTTLFDLGEEDKIEWRCFINFLDKRKFPRRLVGYNHE